VLLFQKVHRLAKIFRSRISVRQHPAPEGVRSALKSRGLCTKWLYFLPVPAWMPGGMPGIAVPVSTGL
jgi:hypothetical protein